MRVGIRTAMLVLAALLSAGAAAAHEARPASLEIRETAPGQFNLLWRTPVLAGMRLPVRLRLPDGLRDRQEPLVQELADSIVERRFVDAGPGGLAGRRIEFVGLQLTITDVLVQVALLDGRTWTTIARPPQPWVAFAAPLSPIQIVARYVRQGTEHVVRGPEHLVFVLGLLLIATGARSGATAVAAAVLAASVSLTLAMLGFVSVPTLPVDAAIAAGILVLGLAAICAWRGEASFTLRHPWVLAFALGLLHGLSYASGLAGVTLLRAELPLALLSFNGGLAVAQLGCVLLIVLAARALRRPADAIPGWLPALPAYVVGSLGAFWAIERVLLALRGA
jgi:hypothetical protein